jgi:uncharacterized protein (TIGR00269 family)
MRKFKINSEIPLMVAVSGGKDSLVAWSVLHELGYHTKGLHIHLGIEGFSEASSIAVRQFADSRGLPWAQYSLSDVVGDTIPAIEKQTWRKICSICGLLKRQMINRLTIQEGFSHLVVGHNLDDEAGRLLGNIMRHRSQYFAKQYPFLPSYHPRIPARLKPLYRLEAREIRIYCRYNRIAPVAEKCTFAKGATSHAFKDALELLEERMPGTKRDFLFSYIDKREPPQPDPSLGACRKCGEPAFNDICSVCNLFEKILADKSKKKS